MSMAAGSPREYKILLFDDLLKQLAASHQEELEKLREGLEEDRDRWRTKARDLEMSLARGGSNPNVSTVTSGEVQVQTDDDSEGFSDMSSEAKVQREVSMGQNNRFVTVMKYNLQRTQTNFTTDTGGSVLQKRSRAFLKMRKNVRKILEWPWFDFTMGVIIFVNSITIGLQADFSINEEAHRQKLQVLGVCDYIFLAIYVVELAFRFIGMGRNILYDRWIQFDVVLVAFGLLSAFLTAFLVIAADAFGDSLIDFVQSITVLRILRLCRMVRALRVLGKWKTLWGLVKGILNGLETMVSTLVMICFTLFLAACFGVEFVARNKELQEHPLTKEIVEDRFNSSLNIFLTLLQFVTADSISGIYFPIIKVKPLLVLYFGLLVTLLSLMLANLVTAVLVDDAIRGSQMDDTMEKEHQRRRFSSIGTQISEGVSSA